MTASPDKQPHDPTEATITYAGIKARGWTETLINQFCPAPLRYQASPVFRSSVPSRLYALAEIEAIETSPAFQDAKARIEVRRRAARSNAAKCRQATLARVDSLPPPAIPRYPLETLKDKAIADYDARWAAPGVEKPATDQEAEEGGPRLAVNYLQHAVAPYEELMRAITGRIGAVAARRLIRTRLLHAIAEAYPALAAECTRQIAEELDSPPRRLR